MGVIRWLIIMVVLVALIVFGVENMKSVAISYYFGKAELPLFFLVLISIFAGSALAGMIGLADQIKLHSKMRRQKKAIAKLEDEVKSLRNLPLEEEGQVEGGLS